MKAMTKVLNPLAITDLTIESGQGFIENGQEDYIISFKTLTTLPGMNNKFLDFSSVIVLEYPPELVALDL